MAEENKTNKGAPGTAPCLGIDVDAFGQDVEAKKDGPDEPAMEDAKAEPTTTKPSSSSRTAEEVEQIAPTSPDADIHAPPVKVGGSPNVEDAEIHDPPIKAGGSAAAKPTKNCASNTPGAVAVAGAAMDSDRTVTTVDSSVPSSTIARGGLTDSAANRTGIQRGLSRTIEGRQAKLEARSIRAVSKQQASSEKTSTGSQRGLSRTAEERQAKLEARKIQASEKVGIIRATEHGTDGNELSGLDNDGAVAAPPQQATQKGIQRGLGRTIDERQAKLDARNSHEAAAVEPITRSSTPGKQIQRGLRRTTEEMQAKLEARNDARNAKDVAVVDPTTTGDISSQGQEGSGQCTAPEYPPSTLRPDAYQGDGSSLVHNNSLGRGPRVLGIEQDTVTSEDADNSTINNETPEDPENVTQDPFRTGDGNGNNSNGPSPLTRGNSGLAVAKPVEDDTASLMEAQEVDPEELERLEISEAKRRQCGWIGCAIVAVCCIVVGLTLGLTLGKKAPSVPPTMAPSLVPSGAPSSAPTSALDVLLQDLPDYTLASLKNSSSPQWQARVWLENHPDLPGMEEWRKKQLFALATFFYAMEGPSWPKIIKDNWLQHSDECYWFSSEFGDFRDTGGWEESVNYNVNPCNEKDEFQSILLSRMQLSGLKPFIPPEITLLTSLSILALPLNDINASFADFIPSELYQMTNVTVLNLHTNSLWGTVPSELGMMSAMVGFSLGKNALTATIPTELGLLSSAEYIWLHENAFTGPIPTELGMMALIELSLRNNALTGPIPIELGLLNSTTKLFLFYNHLSGSIPSQLGLMTNLELLRLHVNDLTGQIPSELGLMTAMVQVALRSNYLTGPIPTELGLWTSTTGLFVYDNSLSGSVPTELGLMTSTTALYLHTNSLTGSLPSEVAMMTDMDDLKIYSNALTGTIPCELGLMNNLADLRLYSNNLNGTLPKELGALTSLTDLYLHINFLTGPVPSELGLMTELTKLYVFNNQLTGTVPDSLCSLSGLDLVFDEDEVVCPTNCGRVCR